jgi:hypothetical protein
MLELEYLSLSVTSPLVEYVLERLDFAKLQHLRGPHKIGKGGSDLEEQRKKQSLLDEIYYVRKMYFSTGPMMLQLNKLECFFLSHFLGQSKILILAPL